MFSKRATCHECGTVLKSEGALYSHVGSRPCQLAAVQRRMSSIGWALCRAVDAKDVLQLTDVEYEEAAAEYFDGRMVHATRHPKTDETLVQKARFVAPDLRRGIWCPAWAVPIVDDVVVPCEMRAAVINTLRGDATKIRAWQVAVALDMSAAYAAYSEGAHDS